MLTRQAILEDTTAITALYRSVFDAVDYESLSIYERWQRGGPWLSVETCAVWLAHLLQSTDGIPLVAEDNGEVVGEAEVFISREPLPYGFHLNISTLCVRNDHQGRGVGRALIDYITRMAEVLHCQRITVAYPEPNEFYEALGFEPYAARYRVTFPALEGRVFYRAREPVDENTAQVSGWYMPLGRFQNAREEWERMRWYIWNAVPELVEATWQRLYIDLTGQPGILHLHQRDEDPECATVRLWTKNPISSHILTAVTDRVARLNYRRLTTIIEEPVRPLLGEGVEKSPPQWLYARLAK